MKRIRNLIISFLFCISFNINAEQNDIFDEIHVSVNGLVCDFCAQSIVKMLNKEEILLKKSNAGANATGRKFNFPENINRVPIIIIKKKMKYFLCLFVS